LSPPRRRSRFEDDEPTTKGEKVISCNQYRTIDTTVL
jgi:hypothetical protein